MVVVVCLDYFVYFGFVCLFLICGWVLIVVRLGLGGLGCDTDCLFVGLLTLVLLRLVAGLILDLFCLLLPLIGAGLVRLLCCDTLDVLLCCM